ncbi:beta-2 adrenergic receptor-like [Glandiceps talaboti]
MDENVTIRRNLEDSLEATLLHSTILGTLMILIILGNGLLILAIATTSRLRTVTNFFIVSLALSDVMVGIIVIPLNFAFPTALLKGYTTCIYVACFTVVVCISSIMNIVAVTVDRYVAITSPLKYKCIMKPWRAVLLIVLVWTYAFVVGFLPIMGWRGKSNTCQRGEVYGPGYAIFLSVMGLFLPVAASTYLYCRILREATLQAKRIQQCQVSVIEYSSGNDGPGRQNEDDGKRSRIETHSNNDNINQDKQGVRHSHKGHCRSNRKAFRTVLYILAYFEISWLPLFVSLLTDAFYSPLLIPLEVRTFISLLALGNSAMDPVIYGYFNRDLRIRLKEIISKCFLFYRRNNTIE